MFSFSSNWNRSPWLADARIEYISTKHYLELATKKETDGNCHFEQQHNSWEYKNKKRLGMKVHRKEKIRMLIHRELVKSRSHNLDTQIFTRSTKRGIPYLL